MIFTISNSVASRFIAAVAMLAMVAGVMAPVAVNAQEAAVDPAPTCTVIVTSNENGDNPTNGGVETYVHSNWTEDIIGAQWLWSDALVTDTTVDQVKTFTHDFIWGGDTITNIDFQFAADNGYVVELNGVEIGSESFATNNHESVTQLTVDPSDVIVGGNTLSFEITNLGVEGSTYENNPAGFAFKMIIDGTGTACDEIPAIDVCENIDDVQETVPRGYEEDGGICTLISTTVSEGEDRKLECIGENLLTNGSFETPVVDGQWEIFASVLGWLSSASELEIWKNFNGSGADSAADGEQNAELDGNTPTTISQNVTVVPGNKYQVSFAFSPRAGRDLADNAVKVKWDGVNQGTVSADGTSNSGNVWTDHYFTVTADDVSALVELEDIGTATSYGTLIDDVSVCLVERETVVATSTISGHKFNDRNADGEWNEGEEGLKNWEIVLTQGDSEPQYDLTDENGYYSFEVEDGSYQVSETGLKGWEQTATIGDGADGDICYITVGEGSGEIGVSENGGFEGSFGPQSYTCDFGNHQIEVKECTYTENLLVNGSFETPVVENVRGWDIFESVVNGLAWTVSWLNPSENAPEVASLELHRSPLFPTASNGVQYAELDSNYTHPDEEKMDGDARVKIGQTVETVPGEEYTLTFDFSAIPWGRSLKNNIVIVRVDGAIVYTASESLPSGATDTDWSNHTVTFTAASAETEITFEDGATTEPQMTNTVGTLIDNVSLVGCLPEDDGEDGGGDDDDTPTRRGGGGGGTRIDRTPAGEVLGAQATTPTGLVMGEATSTLPMGAPNTGAGGTAQVTVQLPTIVAVLPKTQKIK